MTVYSLETKNIPNQEFSTTINNVDITIQLKAGPQGITLATVSTSTSVIAESVPCFANQVILPYPWMESEINGNLVFVTENDEYPYWENFGTSCNLYFYDLEDLEDG